MSRRHDPCPTRTRPRPAWTIALLTLCFLMGPTAPSAADEPALTVPQRLDEIERYYHDSRRLDEAMENLALVRDDPAQHADHRSRAGSMMVHARLHHRQWEPALLEARRLGAILPGDRAVQRASLILQAEVFRRWSKWEESLEPLRELEQTQADDPAAVSAAKVRLADSLRRLRRNEESRQEADAALEIHPDAGADQTAWALKLVAWAAHDLRDDDGQMAAFERLSQAPYWARVPRNEQRDLCIRYGDCLIRAGRHDEALAHYRDLEEGETDTRQAQEWALYRARTLSAGGDHEGALHAYERVFIDHAARMDYWETAQREIVSVRLAMDDLPGALADARLCLDVAGDANRLADRVRLIADVFRRIDTHLERANTFILYQRHGPAGSDGQAGTEDDLADPLAPYPRPRYEARDEAFAAHHAGLGDRATASRYRAISLLYSGQADQALAWFLDAFRRAPAQEFQTHGRELIVLGVRSRLGHAVGLDAFFDYINHGPAGPDGRRGTEDDLADPFGALDASAVPAGQGGANRQSEGDLTVLRELVGAVGTVAQRPGEAVNVRRDAMAVLERLHQALDDWGAPGQAGHYLDWLLDSELHEQLIEPAGQLALAAARGRQLHLGGAHAFWASLEADLTQRGQPMPNQLDRLRRQFDTATRALGPETFAPPDVPPYHLQTAPLHLDRLEPLAR